MNNQYNIFGYNINEWLTERCIICDSVNHIFLNQPHADAWECYCCGNRWWFDDVYSREAYMLLHNRTEQEAEQDLRDGNMIFLNGQLAQW